MHQCHVPITMAPADSQKIIAEYGGPEYAEAITAAPQEIPLPPDKLVYAFSRLEKEVTTGKTAEDIGRSSACASVSGEERSRMAIAARDFRELRLDGMDRNFGVVNALKGVTLTVRRGEFIALLGPSGCGKPTALNCVAGLLTLSGGSIWLDKTRIDRLAVEERGFGMVFQNYALFPHMSVRRNIGFGLKMRGRVKTEITRKVMRC
jgi:ABC-type glutathione transport system ATPase component